MAGWLDHKALKIIKGIGSIPTDNNSPENKLVVVNLLSNLITLAPDGWSPNIPVTKNGGVWADSPVSDGRQLIAAAAGNVTEKMTLIISDNSYLGMVKAYLGLNKMAQDCRDFWEKNNQIDPVWLEWAAGCNTPPLSQYAQIYNIELVPEYVDGAQPTIRVSMTIEREQWWRGIPPGANPKLWTFYINSVQPNTTNVELRTRTDDLIYNATIVNKHEWNPTDYLSTLSKNYIDIPDTTIPGDAPALVELLVKTPKNTLGGNPLTARNIYVWQSTRPTTIKDRTGSLFGQSDIINCGDCFISVGPTKTIDAVNGVFSNGSAVNRFIITYTLGASATFNDIFSTGVIKLPPINIERGAIAIFLRCKQTTGSAGDVQVRYRLTNNLSVASGAVVNFATGDYNAMPTPPAAYPFGLLYLGSFNLPVNSRAAMSGDGRGLEIPLKATQQDLALSFDVKNNVAANRNLQFLDIILMHQDESFIALNQPAFDGLPLYNRTESYVYDNTGYFGHGDTQPIGITGLTTFASYLPNLFPEIVGRDLTLTPHINNRLYFLSTFGISTDTQPNCESGVEGDLPYEIHLNIVPRWSGIRDV